MTTEDRQLYLEKGSWSVGHAHFIFPTLANQLPLPLLGREAQSVTLIQLPLHRRKGQDRKEVFLQPFPDEPMRSLGACFLVLKDTDVLNLPFLSSLASNFAALWTENVVCFTSAPKIVYAFIMTPHRSVFINVHIVPDSHVLHESAGAVGTLTDSNHRDSFSHSPGGWKSKIKVLAGLVSSEAPFLDVQMAAFT